MSIEANSAPNQRCCATSSPQHFFSVAMISRGRGRFVRERIWREPAFENPHGPEGKAVLSCTATVRCKPAVQFSAVDAGGDRGPSLEDLVPELRCRRPGNP